MFGAFARRPALAAAGLYAVVAIALVAPALLPGKTLSMSDQLSVMAPWQGAHTSHLTRPAVPATENSDATTQLRPFLEYSAQRLPGMLLWDPYIMNGRPFMANAQSAVFSLFHDAALLEWLVFAGLAFALLALRVRGRLATGPFVALAVLLLVADLLKAGMGYNPAVHRSDTNPPATGAIRYLQRDPSTHFVSQTLDIPDNVIPLRYRLLGAGGYDLPIIKRYDRLWPTQVEPECPTEIRGFLGPDCIRLALINVTERGVWTLGLLDVTRLLQPPSQPLLHLPNLVPAYLGPDARVYRITNALPRAFVAGAQHVVGSGDAALAAVTNPGFDRTAVAVTERALPGVATDTFAHPAAAGTATIVHSGEESVAVRVNASRPGVLVLTDTYFPGWSVSVDQHPARLAQVDYILRGVPIGPGVHTVRFSYAPASWTVGWILSLLSLLAAFLAVVFALARRAIRGSSAGPRIETPPPRATARTA